jgi:broad specificity phosphatase PhoE
VTTLILVRHGETDWNATRRIQGSTDIPLNDTGRAQAREVAERLQQELSAVGPVVVASSDLSRAVETARIIAATLAVPAPRTYRQLRERSYGIAEARASRSSATVGVVGRGGGAGGGDLAAGAPPRAGGLQRAVRDARRDTAPQAPTVIVVSHGALIREVIRHASPARSRSRVSVWPTRPRIASSWSATASACSRTPRSR